MSLTNYTPYQIAKGVVNTFFMESIFLLLKIHGKFNEIMRKLLSMQTCNFSNGTQKGCCYLRPFFMF